MPSLRSRQLHPPRFLAGVGKSDLLSPLLPTPDENNRDWKSASPPFLRLHCSTTELLNYSITPLLIYSITQLLKHFLFHANLVGVLDIADIAEGFIARHAVI
jgi:hypothetical protein